MATLESYYESIARGRHGDPFKILGPHGATKNWTVRSFQPQAQAVEVLDANDELLTNMRPLHGDGLFEARLPLPVASISSTILIDLPHLSGISIVT